MTSPISHSSNPFPSPVALPQNNGVAPTLEFAAPTQNQNPNALGEFVGLMHYPRELLERFILDMPISDREINLGKHKSDVSFSFNFLKMIFASPATIAEWIEQNKIRLIDLNLSMDKLEILFPDLTYLDLSGMPMIPSGLEKCKKLKTLILTQALFSSINEIALIGKLTTLTSLDLSDCDFSDLGIMSKGLKELGNLTQLTELNLSQARISDYAFATLGTLTALKKLNLQGCFFLRNKSMESIQLFKDLTHLDISHCEYFSEEDLTLLGKLKSLISLNLKSCKMTNHSLSHIVQFEKLTSLNLSECRDLTEEALSHLLLLKDSLTCLDLSRNSWLTDTSAEQLANFTKLTTLSLEGCDSLTDASLPSLTALTQLTSLNLVACENFTHGQLLPLLGNLVNLSSLLLHGGKALRDDNLQLLTKLKKLTKLHISATNFLTDVNCLQELEALTHLELHAAYFLSNEGIEGIGKLTNLNKLSLFRCTKLTDINCLQSLSNLASLNLYNTSLDDAGVKDLVNLKSLLSLTLGECHVIQNFSFLSGFKNLTHLAIQNCKGLTDIAMSDISTLPKLFYLNLMGNHQLKNVTALAECASLRNLVLERSLLSQESTQDLRKLVRFVVSSGISMSSMDGITYTDLKIPLPFSNNT